MKALYICAERPNWNLFISFFRKHLEDVELFCARNGSDAMDIIIHESPISIIIIDDELKDEEQITIAEDVIEASGQRPIIFLGSEENIKGVITDEFFTSYKTNEVLDKPYKDEDLKVIVEKAMLWSQAVTVSDNHKTVIDEEYVPIKLKSFYLYDKVAYDVYFQVYTDNYMKVITKNKRYPESTIQNLARKNIKDLYLIKTEKIKFLEESMTKAIEILTNKNTSVEKIIMTQVCGTMLIHEMLNEVGVSESVLILSELIIDVVADVSEKYKSFNSLFIDMPISFGDIGEQAIFMLYLSSAITKVLDWKSDLTLKKLGLSCLIHDCKLQYDELSFIRDEQDEKLKGFNLADLALFKEHSSTAAQISTEFSNFPDCSFIIQEHHTIPEKKYTQSMNSISCLFALMRRLTTELTSDGFTQAGVSQALPKLKPYDYGNFKKSFDALVNLFSKV